jgi:ankyrin repeat protein/Tfp pilus assembly protein PilF
MDFTNIFDAVIKGTVEDIRYFLEQKDVDLNARDEIGYTLLEFAVERDDDNSADIVKFLISKGADVHAKNSKGWTPLYTVKKADIAKLLISAGAEVNAKDIIGFTPLHIVRNSDIAKLLISTGADVNAKDIKWGMTPLHNMSTSAKKEEKNGFLQDYYKELMKELIEIAKILVSSGADVNAKASDGSTPLSFAAVEGNLEFFETLVSLGADVNVKNDNGISPLGTAEHNGHAAIVRFLTKGERNISDEDLKNAQEAAKRAMNHEMNNDYASAIKEYTEAIRFDPHYAIYYEDRGSAYFRLSQPESGIKDLTEAIRLNPESYRSFFYRGGAYSQLGKYEQAIKDYDEALRLNPDNYLIHITRGEAYLNLKMNDKAKQDFEKVISLNPDEEEILSYAKELLGKIG